ncbi:hypothetical protein BZA70DRAFT_290632 [Myxozyma melibiosi]|uniref:Ribosomal protein bL31m N-terminal domain-containing protein n=1 Tax=Myxozyma melibiosi TaxID=54550 RepID=A0ABR1F2L4_9ASCO
MALSIASRSRPLVDLSSFRSVANLAPRLSSVQMQPQLEQRRAYEAALPKQRRQRRHLLPGKTRPPLYHKFDCLVELSDGSTFVRQSPFPRVEWRYLRDQRVHPLWNPTIAGFTAVQADNAGRVAKFNQKFVSDLFEGDEEGVAEDGSLFDENVDALFGDFEHKESLNVRVYQRVRSKGKKGSSGKGRYS